MKNLFKIAIGICLLFTASLATAQSSSQRSYFVSSSNGSNLDTVTNGGVKTQKLQIAGYQDLVSIQVNLANISGTNGGVVRLFGSDDGVNFVRIPTYTATNTVAIDSLVAETNNMNKIFRVPSHWYSHYQITYTGTGTMAVQLQSLAIYRRH